MTRYTKNSSVSVRTIAHLSNLPKSNFQKNKIAQGDRKRKKECAPNYKKKST